MGVQQPVAPAERLNLFREDPIVWRTFGLAVGAALGTLALIRALVVKAFASIQLAPALSAITAQGRVTIDDLYRQPAISDTRPASQLPPLTRTVTWPRRQVVLQQLDLRLLCAAAGSAVIVLRACVGDTLQEGALVADVHGADVPDVAVLGGLVNGQERAFGQDPLLAFRLLADIGLRALSPAVNDPATAVQVLDAIESLLETLTPRDLDVAEVTDDTGTVRVVLSLPSWDDYVRIALDDFVESSSRSPMVLLRARSHAVRPAKRCAAAAQATDRVASSSRRRARRRPIPGALAQHGP